MHFLYIFRMIHHNSIYSIASILQPISFSCFSVQPDILIFIPSVHNILFFSALSLLSPWIIYFCPIIFSHAYILKPPQICGYTFTFQVLISRILESPARRFSHPRSTKFNKTPKSLNWKYCLNSKYNKFRKKNAILFLLKASPWTGNQIRTKPQHQKLKKCHTPLLEPFLSSRTATIFICSKLSSPLNQFTSV